MFIFIYGQQKTKIITWWHPTWCTVKLFTSRSYKTALRVRLHVKTALDVNIPFQHVTSIYEIKLFTTICQVSYTVAKHDTCHRPQYLLIFSYKILDTSWRHRATMMQFARCYVFCLLFEFWTVQDFFFKI